jgi:hypothetical protein
VRVSRRNSNFGLTLKSELEKIAEEVGVSYEAALDVMDIYFLNMKKVMASPLMQKVSINKFAIFSPTVGMIRMSLLAAINKYKAKPTLENRSNFIDKYINSWWIRQNLIKDSGEIEYESASGATSAYLVRMKKKILKKDFHKYYDTLGRRIIYKENEMTDQVFTDEDY